ncbi:hypothetical protein [Nocardiopsis sp. NPDC006938]|uniref:hypothetical protein n=1 Tax=Nocardiopsis sp. NPDC006938 TaxID=3364337 RepID=UPI0036CC057B
MPDRHEDRNLRDALRVWDAERRPQAPPFTAVLRRIAAAPSPLDRPRWPVVHVLRLAMALARAQLRIVPWLVVPAALLTAALAALAARVLGVGQDSSVVVTAFSSLMLVGVAVTVTMALSTAGPDALSLSTPLGPPVVVMARVTVVLGIDASAGVLASWAVASWGAGGGFAAVLAGWAVPLAVVAGLVTCVALWTTPWAGAVTGLLLVPFVSPRPEVETGVATVVGLLWEIATPTAAVVLGAGLLAAAAASSHRALASGATATA